MPPHTKTDTGRIRRASELAMLPDDAIVAAGEVAVLIGKSVETLRRWRKKNLGPRYLKATARLDAAEYRLGDVRDWTNARTVRTGGFEVQDHPQLEAG